jgi:ribosomal-protein-alanine N-acetyltransferase
MAGVRQFDFSKLFVAFPTLVSENYLLNNIVESNPQQLFDLYSHPEVIRYIDMPTLNSLADAQNYIFKAAELFDKQQKVVWAIYSKEQIDLLGIIRLFGINREHHFANIGFELNRQCWGKGIISECLQVVLHFLFTQVQFNRIEAQTFVGNERSIKLLERLGFKREGRLQQNFLIKGNYEDSYLYALINKL